MAGDSGGNLIPLENGKDPSSQQQILTAPTNLDQKTATMAWAMGGATGRNMNMRPFNQIIEQELKNRNILEIHLRKTTTNPKNITFDELGDFIFDVLKVNPTDCIGFDYTTGRYDTREIKFKPNIDLEPYLSTTPYLFMEHEITVRKQLSNVTKVTFKNVPLNVPDEEIFNLCLCYGTVTDDTVHYEKMFNSKNKGMPGSTRFVYMNLDHGSLFENFYWMEGPLAGDSGRRILVLHNGQVPQCSNCLKTVSQGCKAGANGKICISLNTPRTKMNVYMESLKHKVGYVSLKMKYQEAQAKHFPSLRGINQPGYTMDEDDVEEVLPTNPIEEKDKKIEELEKTLATQKEEISELNQLKEALTKTKAELNTVKKEYTTSIKKLNYTKNATEQKIGEVISNPDFFREDPYLVSVYAATLNLEEFDSGEAGEDVLAPKENFLKKVEENIDKNNSEQNERYNHFRNQILEKVKMSKSRQRTLSTSSQTSRGSSRKRNNSGGQSGKSPTRQKTGIPALKQK